MAGQDAVCPTLYLAITLIGENPMVMDVSMATFSRANTSTHGL
jgi:hypothetical protein